jgi:hypothetical protein
MKPIKAFIVALLILGGSTLYAQSNSKVIAVVNKANWCPVCEKNGERVMTQVLTQYKEPQVTIVANDLTDEDTKAESKAALEKLGVYKLVEADNKTGQIIFIDRKNKKVINKISVAKSNDELKKAFDQAIRRSYKGNQSRRFCIGCSDFSNYLPAGKPILHTFFG